MSWYRIDEQREISADFITCAEYQLFLDEKRAENKYYQPDHWDGYQFSRGNAEKPILGVRGEDASQFCAWLSQQHGEKFRYQLPTLEEVSTHPWVAGGKIGCWCVTNGKRFVHVPDTIQWKKWRKILFVSLTNDWNNLARDFVSGFSSTLAFNLASVLELNLVRAFARDLALDRSLSRTLDHPSVSALSRDLDRDLELALDRARELALDLALELALDRARALDRAFARDLALDLALDLDRDLELALDLDRDLELALDRARAFARDLALDLAHAHAHARARARVLDRDRAIARNLDRDLALARAIDRALDRNLARDLALTRDQSADRLSDQRMMWSTIIFFLTLIEERLYSTIKRERSFTTTLAWFNRHWLKPNATALTVNIEQLRDAGLDSYTFFCLIEERLKGNLPVWEGIRIVRVKSDL